LRTAVSAVFVVQLLISSLCFATPASAAQPILSGHCHEQMQIEHAMTQADMPMQKGMHHDSDHVCAHCDSPQNLNTVSHATDLAPTTMLLAYVSTYAEIQVPIAAEPFSTDKAQAPPDSSTLLLTKTQRIRI